MLNIKPSDLALGPDHKGVLSLGRTKSSQQRGAQDLVTIDDPWVGRLLAAAAAAVDRWTPIVNMSGAAFRKFFDEAFVSFGLGEFNFRPYSVRRGAAVSDYLSLVISITPCLGAAGRA